MQRWPRLLTAGVIASVTLGPPTAAQEQEELGTLQITAPSLNAVSVFVEGFSVGQTPVTVTDLPPGDYRVVVKHPGGGDFVHDVTLAKGQAASVVGDAASNEFAWSSPVRLQDDWRPVSDEEQKSLEKATATRPLSGYGRLEIANFLVKSEDDVPAKYLYALFGSLVKELDRRKKLNGLEFATNYSKGTPGRWTEAPSSEGQTMVLSGVVTEYQAGSRTKRYLVGFGAGKTRVYCLFRLVDKATGDVLLERLANGSISGGLFGGSGSGAMKELGSNISKAIEKSW